MSERLIDQLVVELSLDAAPYKKTEKDVAELTKKTAQMVEKGTAKNDGNDKKRDRDRAKRARDEETRRRKAHQEQQKQTSELKDQLVGLGRTAAGMFLGFETLKGAGQLFSSFVANTSAMGRSAENLGVGLHEFQSFGAAIKLAGGDAEAAKGQFASMQQAIFAMTTRGERSPFIQTLATMGVYLRDAKGQVKPLTELLNELADAMQKRGLNRAQAFQFLQGASVGEDVANLLLDPNRKQKLAQASLTSIQSTAGVKNAQELQAASANFRNNLGALGTQAGNSVVNTLLQIRDILHGNAPRTPTTGYYAETPKARIGFETTGSPYRQAIEDAQRAHHIPDNILGAIAYQESHMNPDAVNSKTGAAGIMQLMPNIFPGAGKDPLKDIETAATELERLFKQFGNWTTAVAAYNDGSGNIESLLATGKRKNGKEGIPAETANYIANVIGPTPAAAGSGAGNTNTVTTGPVTIQTNASTITGAAEDFSATLKRKMDVTQANTGMSY